MARQIPELDELLGNHASENDLMLIRDVSAKQDKRISLKELSKALGGGADLIDLFYPVGSYYETSDADFDPNEAWGGTWVKDTAGRVLVAQDSGTFATLGGTGGEEAHKLTIAEMPKHQHASGHVNVSYSGGGSSGWNPLMANGINNQQGFNTNTTQTGGDTSHNNLQPYKVVVRWHRTA